jgi:hypothetical protein
MNIIKNNEKTLRHNEKQWTTMKNTMKNNDTYLANREETMKNNDHNEKQWSNKWKKTMKANE